MISSSSLNDYELYKICKEHLQEDLEWPEILKILVKEKRLSLAATVPDLKSFYRNIAGSLAAGEQLNSDGTVYDKTFKDFNKFIGKQKDYFENYSGPKNATNRDVILCIGDLHVPYYDKEKLSFVVEKWTGKANILVINGDFINGDRLSTHAKFKHEDFKKEIAEGRVVAEYLASKFEKVYFLGDNHCSARWLKFLGNEVSPDLHFLMEHPYDYMLKGIPNIIQAKDTHKKFGNDLYHMTVIGDCLFSHAFVSGRDGGSARKVQTWIQKWKSTLQLPDIRMILHGHVHQLSLNFDPDFAVVQTGCFASMDGLLYSLDGKIASNPPVHGYVVIVQEDGVTDFSQTRICKI